MSEQELKACPCAVGMKGLILGRLNKLEGQYTPYQIVMNTDPKDVIANCAHNTRASPWRTDWENAPRDGTVIAVYRPDAGCFAAYFVEEDAHLSTPDHPPEGESYWFSTGGEDLTEDMPTHFMLITPPTEAATSEGGE